MQNTSRILSGKSPLLRLKTLAGLGDGNFDLTRLCPLSLEEGTTDKNTEILKKIRFLVFAMNILDETFIDITEFKRHIYILGDGTIFNFLNKKMTYSGFAVVDKSYHLEIMCTLGLSYRFNVAMKFGYAETNVMQLRLNGWGRAYCFDRENHDDYMRLRNDLYDYWVPILERYKCDYIELTSQCDTLVRPVNIEKIHKINMYVPITIVT